MFAPLETSEFVGTPEQLHRLFYRTLCHELYKKEALKQLVPLVREGDRGVPVPAQLDFQDHTSALEAGIDMAIRDFRSLKQLYDHDLEARTYERMRAVIAHFDCVPDIVCAGITQPTTSFFGREHLGPCQG